MVHIWDTFNPRFCCPCLDQVHKPEHVIFTISLMNFYRKSSLILADWQTGWLPPKDLLPWNCYCTPCSFFFSETECPVITGSLVVANNRKPGPPTLLCRHWIVEVYQENIPLVAETKSHWGIAYYIDPAQPFQSCKDIIQSRPRPRPCMPRLVPSVWLSI